MARLNRSMIVSSVAPRASYHCVTRCTRQLHLLGEGVEESGEPEGLRKELLLARLEVLVGVMAVDVSAFAIMDNHVHLVLRVDREEASGWSDEEVLRRWRGLHPRRDGHNRPRDETDEEAAEALSDAGFLAACREKLCSLSQFMKEFKQHAAERINALEETTGPVWAGRFKSEAIEDEAQLVATMVYVDLNPFAAGVCDTPEDGRHTSLAGRLARDVPSMEASSGTQSADRGAGEASPADGPRRHHVLPRRRGCGTWLRPLDESVDAQRRRGHRPLQNGDAVRAASAGTVLAGLSLRVYLRLIDAVSRRLREGKQRLNAGTRGVFERIGLDADAVSGHVLALIAQHSVHLPGPDASRTSPG